MEEAVDLEMIWQTHHMTSLPTLIYTSQLSKDLKLQPPLKTEVAVEVR